LIYHVVMNPSHPPLKTAVIGVGRMGRHHARIYNQIEHATLVAVVDADRQRAETVADEYGCDALTSVEELLAAHPDLAAASVAVPTEHHLAAARPLLERKIACLIEKPLASTVAQARKLDRIARKHKAVLQVGHTERFNPAIRAVAAMNLVPRFIEVDRISPMSFRSLDVGVVMDMMIHDLDIVLMFARSPIAKIDAVGVAVFGEHEDVTSARINFKSGLVVNLTASRLALNTSRRMRFFSENAYVSLDYQARTGIVVNRSGENVDALSRLREQIKKGADLSDLDYKSLVDVRELTMDLPPGELDPLTAELSSFLRAAYTGEPPAVSASAEAGYAAVEAAERVVEAVRKHRWEGQEAASLLMQETT